MVKQISRDYNTGYSVFAVDTVDEINDLPTTTTKGNGNLEPIGTCCVGSRAIVTETSDIYILNGNKNKWIKVSTSSGGGGGEGYEFATDDEVRKELEM